MGVKRIVSGFVCLLDVGLDQLLLFVGERDESNTALYQVQCSDRIESIIQTLQTHIPITPYHTPHSDPYQLHPTPTTHSPNPLPLQTLTNSPSPRLFPLPQNVKPHPPS